MGKTFYTLPSLPFNYNALEPFMSEEQLVLHHKKHHQAYVDGANNILKQLQEAREKGENVVDIKSILKSLSFGVAGHILHSLFWENLMPNALDSPEGEFLLAIEAEYGNFERFKKEFSQAAVSVEGSGWACLAFEKEAERLIIMEVEKHNVNVIAGLPVLLVLDVFEHAYYLDYKNERSRYVDNFWKIVNWKKIEERFKKIK